jgi:Cu(I)/Ag(I) efflux system membrane protein CusA/SilA
MSVAVWIGLIALLGIDAETGIFMLLCLDLAYEEAAASKGIHDRAGLHQVIVVGAARRIRPKFMTVTTMFVGLLPVLWSSGTGSEVMKRVAAPIVGGIVTSFLLELLVYPILYERWKSIDLKRQSWGRKVGLQPYVLLLDSERRELAIRVSE